MCIKVVRVLASDCVFCDFSGVDKSCYLSVSALICVDNQRKMDARVRKMLRSSPKCLEFNELDYVNASNLQKILSVCTANTTAVMSLRSITFDRSSFGGKGVVQLLKALENSQLETLVIRKDADGLVPADGYLEPIAACLATGVCNLTQLDLSYMRLRAGAVTVLQALETSTCGVSSLTLQGNHLDDACAVAMCESLCRNQRLTSLDVSINAIARKGGVAFGKMLLSSASFLTVLDLSFNYLDISGTRAVLEGLRDSGPRCVMQHVHLGGNQVPFDQVSSTCCRS